MGEHVPAQDLSIFKFFSADAAQEGDVRVGLDVHLKTFLLLEGFATCVADIFGEARLSHGLVHSPLVLHFEV